MNNPSRNQSRSKDLFLFGLLIAILVFLVLIMYQIDRQWQKLAVVEQSVAEQARDMSVLRTTLKSLDRQYGEAQKQANEIAKASSHQAEALSSQAKASISQAQALASQSQATVSQGKTIDTLTGLLASGASLAALNTTSKPQAAMTQTQSANDAEETAQAASDKPVETAKAIDTTTVKVEVNAAEQTASAASPAKKSATSTLFKRAYAATQQPDYAQGGWRIDSFSTGIKSITPFISGDVYAANVQSYVFESLLSRDPETLAWQGALAKSWSISDDGLVITMQLRDDVTFSDGEAFDSSDVVFSFNFIMNEKINAPRERAYYKEIDSVVANGPYEVVLTFKKPYFKALDFAGGMDILAEHFYKEYLDKPEEFNQSKGLLFGTGPYRLRDSKNWTSDQDSIELIRNNRYWGEVQPPYDRIVWRIIQDDTARLTTFRNGDLDILEDMQPIDFNKLKADKQMNEIGKPFDYVSPTSGYGYIGWNQQRNGKPTPFKDKRVRQAMTWILDKQKIIDDIFLGYRGVAVSPFGGSSKQHDPELKPRPQDIAKGKALLKEAGYEDRDGNGVIENAEGEPFEFELVYFQNNETTKRMVLLLKDMYARAGIKLTPKPAEWPVMIEMLEKKNFEAITLGWGGTLESDLYQIFHSSQSLTNGDNYISYENKALDKLIEEARGTMDEAKRMEIWRQAERILYEDVPYTFLTRKKELGFYSQRIGNVGQTALGLNLGTIPLETYIPQALQKHSH